MTLLPDDTAADCLAQSTLFELVSREDRLAILERMRATRFRAGDMIFSRGDAACGLYVLRSGGVGITFTTSDGRNLSFSYATVGAVFGEIATLDGGPRSADATALTDVECLLLPPDGLKAAFHANPRFAEALIRFLCARLRDTDQKLEAIALQSTEARLARFLLAAVKARARGAAKGNVPITLGISQSEIGLLVGASRPKVDAALALLANERAIRLQGGEIVCDVPVLLRIAEREWD